ncbi:MAG TPA: HEAT repeat domain-containing protein [Terriglobales bacterium]|jgi:HEAT repeat protein|nr:HEAT repeat domain-containing protein [Terriglobales bacterium]
MRKTSKKPWTVAALSGVILTFVVLNVSSYAQSTTNSAWPILEAGLQQKKAAQRVAAVRVLGFIPGDPHAVELAENALQDKNSGVRAAAATALGLMHASAADTELKQALKDKDLAVVMAAAHALSLFNDPACYDAYYSVYTGARKNDQGMIAQEMKTLHDPKQLVEMGVGEGIGFVPFAGDGWEAYQMIMKDKKDGVTAKAALVTALAKDPEPRTGKLLLTVSNNRNGVLRLAALQAIAERGDPVLLSGLEPRLSDSKREVRYAAAAAIIHLEDVGKAAALEAAKIAQSELPTKANSMQATAMPTPETK